jgi:hypothetical protein
MYIVFILLLVVAFVVLEFTKILLMVVRTINPFLTLHIGDDFTQSVQHDFLLGGDHE